MKRSLPFALLSLAFLFGNADQTVAQSTNRSGGTQPTQEQSLRELVNEVRQLRALLQRINITVYRTNVVVERLKFQQELVGRLSRELNDVREGLAETRIQSSKMKEHVTRLETAVESGLKKPEELAALKLEIDGAEQRELRLGMRETQLMNELSAERLKLSELNDQLTKLELELR